MKSVDWAEMWQERGVGGVISRERGLMMRGMAIVCIALHNFCHTFAGVVKENEFWFSEENVNEFLSIHGLSLKTIFDLFSYFGWYGVCIFIFLSGYGLVKKYESPSLRHGFKKLNHGVSLFNSVAEHLNSDIDFSNQRVKRFSKKTFLLRNLKKLFLLMLPGIVILILWKFGVYLITGKPVASDILNYLYTLTLLSNLTIPVLSPSPGVYWYFGLATQLYILYALFLRNCNQKILWGFVIICIVLQYSGPSTDWLRHNFPGWLLVFALGICYGRSGNISRRAITGLIIISLIIFFPSSLNKYSWQISIIASIFVFLGIAIASSKIRGWRQFWIWAGRLSPFIFASHPILRIFARGVCINFPQYTLAAFVGYTAALIPMALLYRAFMPKQ